MQKILMTLLLLSMFLIISCDEDIKVYVGDSTTESLVRDQGIDTPPISCKSEEFNNMFCVDSEDMAILIEKCKDD